MFVLFQVFVSVVIGINFVVLLLQCLGSVQRASLPVQMADVLPAGGSVMATTTVQMDLMRCRNYVFVTLK